MTASSHPRWTKVAAYLALAGSMLALAVVTATSEAGGLALDPRSTAPDGTAALVAVLTELGAQVTLARAPGDVTDHDAVVVLRDPGTPEWTAALEDVASAGATVVATDPAATSLEPSSTLVPPRPDPACAVAAFDAVTRVSRAAGTVFEVPEGATGCFPAGQDRAWLVVQARGEGHVVAIGDGGFLTNAALDEADNAVLATALVGPTAGTDVAVVGPDVALAAREGTSSVRDLLPARVEFALVQLLVALLVVVAWRWRRLGAPVEEPLPVELEGSELVRASGELLDQAGAYDDAARRLSAALRRDVARRLGLGAQVDAEGLADAAAGLLRRPPDDLHRALAPPAILDARGLVDHARRVARLRRAAGLGPEPRGGNGPAGGDPGGTVPYFSSHASGSDPGPAPPTTGVPS